MRKIVLALALALGGVVVHPGVVEANVGRLHAAFMAPGSETFEIFYNPQNIFVRVRPAHSSHALFLEGIGVCDVSNKVETPVDDFEFHNSLVVDTSGRLKRDRKLMMGGDYVPALSKIWLRPFEVIREGMWVVIEVPSKAHVTGGRLAVVSLLNPNDEFHSGVMRAVGCKRHIGPQFSLVRLFGNADRIARGCGGPFGLSHSSTSGFEGAVQQAYGDDAHERSHDARNGHDPLGGGIGSPKSGYPLVEALLRAAAAASLILVFDFAALWYVASDRCGSIWAFYGTLFGAVRLSLLSTFLIIVLPYNVLG